ncbi:protein of unknown function [endosymbiont DhMRE of Dentiscutata heterogama]|uniref:hypothetical protein n=1 Tax=endosymbiont DhMRE of Dentiscutata heterogama TaxID=1609546 RepID=UPI000629D742|nr:hypothetical protein [endosymbiont DhMRE of Dentiscutata heterogama]CFW93117.1 protein of unknown function [endosymbiont DhMRE of Dentiscutata heterogama]
MNKNIEIQKIKVNNGQELIAEAKKWKNSGGEWKLRERYLEIPFKGIGKRKNKLGWGIIISNGKQTVDILSFESNLDYKDFVEKDLISFDEVNVRSELRQLFPEVKFAHPDSGGNRKLNNTTYKELKKDNEDYILRRYLVAENNWDLKWILHQYVRENETKIYQSTNPHFAGWVEIIDGQDGNMYLYVGEKNDNGGREIKIGIKKAEFYDKYHNFYEKKDGGCYTAEEMLENYWSLSTIGRPRTPAETHEYYSKNGGLEEEWQRNWPRRQGLCRKYLEELRERLTKKFNYWQEKAKQKNHWDHEANEQILLANHHVAEIDAHLDDMKKNRPAYYAACDKDCDICGVKLCCHFEGRACSSDKKCPRPDENFLHYHGRTPELEENKNNQLTDAEKSQLLQYFLQNGIQKITIENGKLIITHNNNNTIVTDEDSEQQKYHQILEKLPTQTLSLSELRNNNTNSNSNKDDKSFYKGLVVGTVVIILIGLIAYCWRQKKIKK